MTNFLMVAFYFLLELVKNKSANLTKNKNIWDKLDNFVL